MKQEREHWGVLDKLRGTIPDVMRFFVPQLIVQTITQILDGHLARIACDPWAGIGEVIASVQEATRAENAFAFAQDERVAAFGKVKAVNARWLTGDPLLLLSELSGDIDVAASVLPFGVRWDRPITFAAASGEKIEVKGSFMSCCTSRFQTTASSGRV
jgi:hypothetical protein